MSVSVFVSECVSHHQKFSKMDVLVLRVVAIVVLLLSLGYKYAVVVNNLSFIRSYFFQFFRYKFVIVFYFSFWLLFDVAKFKSFAK